MVEYFYRSPWRDPRQRPTSFDGRRDSSPRATSFVIGPRGTVRSRRKSGSATARRNPAERRTLRRNGRGSVVLHAGRRSGSIPGPGVLHESIQTPRPQSRWSTTSPGRWNAIVPNARTTPDARSSRGGIRNVVQGIRPRKRRRNRVPREYVSFHRERRPGASSKVSLHPIAEL